MKGRDCGVNLLLEHSFLYCPLQVGSTVGPSIYSLLEGLFQRCGSQLPLNIVQLLHCCRKIHWVAARTKIY